MPGICRPADEAGERPVGDRADGGDVTAQQDRRQRLDLGDERQQARYGPNNWVREPQERQETAPVSARLLLKPSKPPEEHHDHGQVPSACTEQKSYAPLGAHLTFYPNCLETYPQKTGLLLPENI